MLRGLATGTSKLNTLRDQRAGNCILQPRCHVELLIMITNALFAARGASQLDATVGPSTQDADGME